MDLLNNLKALLVVSTLAGIAFRVAKPFCTLHTSAKDYDRRRNVWFFLTVAAFLSPSIWLYFFIACPVLIWAGIHDSNGLALFVLLMYVIPPYEVELPSILINNLFALNNIRVLLLTILFPIAAKNFFSNDKKNQFRFGLFDFLVLAYIFLQLILYIPYESITNTMRRSFMSFLDIGLIYYVTTRVTANRKKMLDVMSTFCLTCAIFAPIALFESLKTWLPYTNLANTWAEVFSSGDYLYRDGILRAQVTAGHSLALGGLMAIGFGFWLGLSANINSRIKKISGAAWLWMGLLAAYSRAPWLAALLVYVINKALDPQRFKNLFKIILFGGIVVGAILLSPFGDRVIDNLPFIGTVDSDNVAYRQLLAEKSWELVQKNPIFGDPFFLKEMEDLRQGGGIIDLVNAYAAVALSMGLVGLALFVLPIIIGLTRSYKRLKLADSNDKEYVSMNIAMVTTVIGSLLLIGSGGIGPGYGHYLLVSMLIGLTQIDFKISIPIVRLP